MAPSAKPFATFTDTELADAIVRKIFEANLMTRAAELRGISVLIALVDRKGEGYPKGYTEIQANVMRQRA